MKKAKKYLNGSVHGGWDGWCINERKALEIAYIEGMIKGLKGDIEYLDELEYAEHKLKKKIKEIKRNG